MTEAERQANIDAYPPGGVGANSAGCTCPVIDNGHGKGAWGGSIKSGGRTLYWMSADCPLHGYDDEEFYEAYRMGVGA